MLSISRLVGLVLGLVLGATLLGCASEDDGLATAPASSPTPSIVPSDDGYPGPMPVGTLDNTDAYPGAEPLAAEVAPVEAAELPLMLPEPAPGFATIGGVLVDEKTRQAPPESMLYLGQMKYTDQGFPAVSLDKQADPFAVLSPNGAFVFQDVEPGEYALVYFTPDYSFLVEEGDSELSLIMTVAAGDVIDLGLIELPGR